MNINDVQEALTEENFRKYLSEHKDTEFAVADCRECPIAKFMIDQFGPIYPIVFFDEISFYIKEEHLCIDTPVWASLFIRKFDNIKLAGIVNSEEALKCLEEEKS